MGAAYQCKDSVVNADTPRRAETLRVNCFIFGTVRQPPREAFGATRPLLYADELWLHSYGGDEDTHLAAACIEATFELRRRQWDALETLLPFLEPEDEWDDRKWADRLEDLPEPEFHRAARAALELGWITGWE